MKQDNGSLVKLTREIETWKRTLDLLQHENVHQKSALAELIRENQGYNENLLEGAEKFLGQFLQHDQALRLMRSDIGKFETTVTHKTSKHNVHRRGLILEKKKIRREIGALGQNFFDLRNHFSNFLKASISSTA